MVVVVVAVVVVVVVVVASRRHICGSMHSTIHLKPAC